MPRTPRTEHVLRRLRAVIGKSQKDFAMMIGISASALQRIELGSLRISPKIANRIREATGLDTRCLRNWPRGELKSVRGNLYTRAEFAALQHRQSFSFRALRHECDYMVAEIRRRINLLLEVASDRKRFDLVLSDIWSSLDQIRRSFGLERLTNTRLQSDGGETRTEWHHICPPNKAVFFDDTGSYLYPMDVPVQRITADLRRRGQKSTYGRSNDGILLVIAQDVETPPNTQGSAKATNKGRSSHSRRRNRSPK